MPKNKNNKHFSYAAKTVTVYYIDFLNIFFYKNVIKQGTLREIHPYMMNKYVQQAAKRTKGI